MGKDGDAVEKPGKKGVCMKLTQFKELISKLEEIHQNIPQEARVAPCYLDQDHQNPLGCLL